MKELIGYAEKFKSQMNLADFALVKFCLISIGVLTGLGVPKKHRKHASAIAGVVFVVTYAPLMTKFLRIVLKNSETTIEK